VRALDNGGRFYKFFTTARDRVVNHSELARATGSHFLGTKAILYFEMATIDLDPEHRAEVIALLEPELRARYQSEKPQILLPA
jgi:hypothetical protein